MPGALRRTELAQRLGFDLPDALARDVELLSDFLERVLALAADAEAEADHLLLLGRKRLEDVGGFVADIGVDHRVYGRPHPAVFDQIAQGGFAVAADGCLQRHRVARDGLELLDLFDRNIHAPADFVVGRHPAQLLFELARGPQELVHALVHVNRNADGARLVRDGARDGLADPPGGVSGELVAAPVFEFVGGAHQADVALLDQVQQMQSAVDVLLGDRHNQAEVGLDQVFFGALRFDFTVADHRQGVPKVGEIGAGRGLALADFALQLPRLGLGGLAAAALDLAQIVLEVRQLLDHSLNFFRELLPLRGVERDLANGARNLHPTTDQLALGAAAALLVAERHIREPVGKLGELLVQADHIAQSLLNFSAPLQVGGAFHFQVAQIDEGFQILDLAPDLVGDFGRMQLHQRGAADGLLHAEFAPFHAPRQVDFALPRQQRDSAHFAQIHAYRIVRVDGLLHRMRGSKLLAVMHFLWMEETTFLIKRKPQRLMPFA